MGTISAFTFTTVTDALKGLFESYGELIIIVASLIVLIIILSIINGGVRKKRKKHNVKSRRNVKVLPDVKKILGFNPYDEIKTENGSGDFYAIASSTASVEDALEIKLNQKRIAEEKIAAILVEKKEIEERQTTYNGVIVALKNELANEKSKGRNKNKNRISDIDSEIKNNVLNLSDCEVDLEFCSNKMAICSDALEHLNTQIRSLEITMSDKREALNSIENKNGATYESVKLYEKGMRIVKEFPKIKEPLLSYIRNRLKMEEYMQKYNALASENNLHKTEVRQMSAMLAQVRNASPEDRKSVV